MNGAKHVTGTENDEEPIGGPKDNVGRRAGGVVLNEVRAALKTLGNAILLPAIVISDIQEIPALLFVIAALGSEVRLDVLVRNRENFKNELVLRI